MAHSMAGDGVEYRVLQGDCLDILPTLEANSVDSIVTDPPYGLGFMGKDWDHGVPGVHFWEEALRVAKPGAHLLAFGGTRTFHRLAVAIEDAGWEIRDTIMWVYGSGFPKSHDVSKAIDKAAGAEREVVGRKPQNGAKFKATQREIDNGGFNDPKRTEFSITAPATEAAQQWEGWGTALKPAWEPVIVARKPLTGTVAQNVLEWGTGGINVDGCRVGTEQRTYTGSGAQPNKLNNHGKGDTGIGYADGSGKDKVFTAQGRWPANLIHDGSDEVVELFPESKSTGGQASLGAFRNGDVYGKGKDVREKRNPRLGDTGSAARFFYCAKASKADRDEGCEGMEERDGSVGDRRPSGSMSQRIHADEGRPDTKSRNHHPTVKPTALMRYLCRLVTPPNGIVLDPFAGSGSTGKAAILDGFRFIGVELDPVYVVIAESRIGQAAQEVSRHPVVKTGLPNDMSGLPLFDQDALST